MDKRNSIRDVLEAIYKNLESIPNRKGKDIWDKFQILGTLLLPATIALVGIYYTEAKKSLERSQAAAFRNDHFSFSFIRMTAYSNVTFLFLTTRLELAGADIDYR